MSSQINYRNNLLARCLEPLADHLNDLENDRASYDGYPRRQARYDEAIRDLRELSNEIRDCLRGT